MNFTSEDLKGQLDQDRAYFERLKANVKNALVSEITSFWPKAKEVWPDKFTKDQPGGSDN